LRSQPLGERQEVVAMGAAQRRDLLLVQPVKLRLHPVRLRILEAFLGDRKLTTADLRAELPDISAASLYRHIAFLVEGGVLEVVAERRVRGAVEQT
jgi:Fe2+ or Zn2+ uptake regulation protein